MDSIAEWLAKISWPLVSRLFASIGIGTVTYVGAESAIDGALSSSKLALSGLTSETLQLLAMAGFFDAMSILSGGVISGLSWIMMKRFALNTTAA
ncbi:MAG: DUF2523 domain-containing protein [Giesbergeria sp.]|uniref:DUF2523 domain-containing protein n=1 Tax=Giesbergeria sp. TaxID=2818473 RepID=UPI0026243360|nr:DUF2523 domain-containing protein [Giesbergeria sp.]MDD2609641.1 DUF2523 domain-containing protein [Giesbergeria sp.]